MKRPCRVHIPRVVLGPGVLALGRGAARHARCARCRHEERRRRANEPRARAAEEGGRRCRGWDSTKCSHRCFCTLFCPLARRSCRFKVQSAAGRCARLVPTRAAKELYFTIRVSLFSPIRHSTLHVAYPLACCCSRFGHRCCSERELCQHKCCILLPRLILDRRVQLRVRQRRPPWTAPHG